MDFEIKHSNDVYIFKLNDKKLDSTLSGDLKGEFTKIIQSEDIKKFILDLSEVDYCDSSGLSSLLLAYRMVRDNQGVLRIAGPSEKVKSLIKISQLDRYLISKETVEEALADIKS